MKDMLGKITILCVLYIVLVSNVQAYTGNDLYRYCSSNTVVNESLCIGYIIGYSDGFDVAYFKALVDTEGSKKLINPYCLPDGVTYGQMKDVVVKFLRENPSKRHINAKFLILQSFEEVFPCPKGD